MKEKKTVRSDEVHSENDDCATDYQRCYHDAIRYIRGKVNQLLEIMGTFPLKEEELDDETLINIDPIGIVADSFRQVLEHQKQINQSLLLANNEIQAIMDAAGAAIVVTDQDLRIEMANPYSEKILLGEEKNGGLAGRHCSEVLCGMCPEIESLLGEVLTAKRAHAYAEVTIRDRICNLVVTPLKETGQVVKVIFLLTDITHQKEAEEKIRMMAAVFENTSEGILITDSDNKIVVVNKAFTDITGYEQEDVIGKNPSILNSQHHDREFFEELWSGLEAAGNWRGEIWDRKKSGEIFAAWQAISVIRHADGTVANYISVLTDISTLKESQAKLDYLAYHDTLTGLGNRLLLNDRLHNAIQRARRRSTFVAVLFLDLDRFKTINDSLGHPVGDKLLVEVAMRIKSIVREEDTVTRPSGDEFVVVMEDVNDDRVVSQIAHKIIKAVRAPIRVEEHELRVTASLGICLYPEDGKDATSLIKHADAAMYLAKDAGKNNYKFYTHQLSKDARDRLNLEGALRRAIEREEFELYYQPIISLETGTLMGAEALLRWQHDSYGWVSPDKFIPIAEETDMIIPLGEWVLANACNTMSRWVKAGADFNTISVNFSGVQLRDAKIVTRMMKILAESELPYNMLELEITENVIMHETGVVSDFLKQMRRYGVRFAIDDFGTGYSSLSYLKRLPVDKLKIDRSFVMDMPHDQNDNAIAEAVIALGQTLGLVVIAEGIETAEQLDILKRLGCDQGQGYLISKPLPVAEFERLYVKGSH